MADLESLKERRKASWRQDGKRRIADPAGAAEFIEEVGICTHYAASSEFPNLFQGYMGDGNAKTTASWDSPSGHVYTWRWSLGGKQAAFYAAIVAGKPTWVSWSLVPYLLAACMEMRTPDELYDSGLISESAYKVACAFDEGIDVLSTKELRDRGGFPTGKDSRARFLKALGELENLLLIAKVFKGASEEDMQHALIDLHYRSICEQARRIGPVDGLAAMLERYLPGAVFIEPKAFARHLRILPEALEAAVDSLVGAGKAGRDGGLVVSLL